MSVRWLTIEDLRRSVSKPRNRAVARFFHELRLAEQWGTGIPRMTEACLAAGLAIPEFEELATHFRVTLRVAESEVAAPRAKVLKAREDAALRILRERSESGASARELAQALGVTDRTARTDLHHLIQ